jgi:hypothetical protein
MFCIYKRKNTISFWYTYISICEFLRQVVKKRNSCGQYIQRRGIKIYRQKTELWVVNETCNHFNAKKKIRRAQRMRGVVTFCNLIQVCSGNFAGIGSALYFYSATIFFEVFIYIYVICRHGYSFINKISIYVYSKTFFYELPEVMSQL